MRYITSVKVAVLATVVLGTGASTAWAADPYLQNLENRRYWDAFDARVRESNMGMTEWMNSVVGGYGHPATPGAAIRPYIPAPLTAAAAQALAITNNIAAREAHNKALMDAAMRNMTRPHTQAPTTVRPVPAPAVGVLNDKAARDAHNKALTDAALRNMTRPHTPAPATTRPTPAPTTVRPVPAPAVGVLNDKAARDAHNKALTDAALRNMGRR